MRKYNIKFNDKDISMLQSMIGKYFEYYRADPFMYSTSVYGEVGLVVDKNAYCLSNYVQPLHYYGAIDDVGIFKIAKVDIEDVKSQLDNTIMVDRPINQKIVSINIVNEIQELFKNGEQIYEYALTRGLIFELEDGLEISFEKDVWFSEDIIVNKGYKLVDKFNDVQEFVDDWKEKVGYIAKCSRTDFILK